MRLFIGQQTTKVVTRQLFRCAGLLVLCAGASSCALMPSFGSKSTSREHVYTLEPSLPSWSAPSSSCGSLALGDVIAAPGYRTSRMAYSAAPFEVSYFAYARWADSVARLLRRPLRQGLKQHGGFSEVLAAPAVAPTQFRTELADVSLVQRFASADSPQSTVELSASLRVFAINPNRVLATKEILLTEAAGGNPASGVAAANTLVARLVDDVVQSTYSACAGAAR